MPGYLVLGGKGCLGPLATVGCLSMVVWPRGSMYRASLEKRVRPEKGLVPEQVPQPSRSQSQAVDVGPTKAETSPRKEWEILITAWEAVLSSKPSRSPGGEHVGNDSLGSCAP